MTMKSKSNGHAGPACAGSLAAALGAAALLAAAYAPAAAMQILAAADHAELTAEVSGRAVSRIALMDDRIARVIRAPDGFAVEHDPARGDLYLRPPGAGGADGTKTMRDRPVTLFLGTEKGFTYHLTLAVRDRGSAQILIRDPAARTGETGRRPARYRPRTRASAPSPRWSVPSRGASRHRALSSRQGAARPAGVTGPSRPGAARASRPGCWRSMKMLSPTPPNSPRPKARALPPRGSRARGPAPRADGSR